MRGQVAFICFLLGSLAQALSEDHDATTARQPVAWEGCALGSTHTYDNPSGGIMTSPMFPNNYPNNTNCMWHFKAPPGKVVRLEFLSFNLDNDDYCPNAWLTVHSYGVGVNGEWLCGLEIPDDQFSRDTDMFLHFLSDTDETTYIGFKIRYSFNYKAIDWEGCDGYTHTYDNSAGGIMTSPMYPKNYPSYVECRWHFEAPPGKVVHLEFLVFNVESSNNCSNDSLTVYNGADGNATMSARLCGCEIPGDQISKDTNMFLHFVSNDNATLIGFKIRYSFNESKPWEGCDGYTHTYDNPAGGIMTSPIFPKNYPNNVDCKWHFEAPPGKVVHLEFLSFNVESFRNCSTDSLTVYNGADESGSISARLCGLKIPDDQFSRDTDMFLRFVSDSNETYIGFKIRYSFNDSKPWEGYGWHTHTYDNPSGGIMTSPMFPHNYPNNADCKWHFQAPFGKVVHLEFLSFNVESSNNCSNDSLTVYNGADANATMSATLCGHSLPKDQAFNETNMFLHFVSDSSRSYSGFQIRYHFNETKPWEGCNGVHHTYDNPSGGIMTSPLFPNNYPNNADCKWHFQAPLGKVVHLEFLSFNVESSNNCSNESLTVYNGADANATMSATLCGHSLPKDQAFNETNMFLHFVSDSSRSYSGFQIRYRFNETKPWEGCNGVHHTYDNPSGGIMTSPLFPNNYPNNADCKWLFQAPFGKVVHLEFLSFNVESSNNCSNDSLTVYNGADANATMSARLCGHSLPKDQAFNETNMFLHFVSDSSRSYSGFQIRYRFNETKPWEGCNGVNHTYDNPSGGIMTSPLFPHNYPKNSDCKWHFQAPPGKVVHLEFLSFNVESDEYVRNCSHDALFIYDSYFPYALGEICGHSLPENQISSGRNMTLHFVSDSGLTYSGFKIRFSFNDSEAIALEGCEGLTHIYDNPSGGIMTSPMFPKNYPNNADCKWLFVAPAGKVVYVEFLSFNVELSSDCDYDALVVYDGVEEYGVLPGQLCGHSLPMNQVSIRRNMTLHFFTDSSLTYSGFQIRYSFNYYGGRASKVAKPHSDLLAAHQRKVHRR